MESQQPRMIIISGPNGAGKTTAAMHTLKTSWSCNIYINADKIAEGLSPLQASRMNVQAGKLMLRRIQECLKENVTFAFETTLASTSFLHTIDQAHTLGYHVCLLFFWLPSWETAYQRVQQRIQAGGHDIPRDVIERRYHRGLQNFAHYADKVDTWSLFDNTFLRPKVIAQKTVDRSLSIMDETRWTLFQKML